MGRVRFPVCNIAGIVDPEEIEAIVNFQSGDTAARRDAACFLQKLAQEQEADKAASMDVIEERLTEEEGRPSEKQTKKTNEVTGKAAREAVKDWKERADLLKATGSLTDKEYQILVSTPITFCYPSQSRWLFIEKGRNKLFRLLEENGVDERRAYWITGSYPPFGQENSSWWFGDDDECDQKKEELFRAGWNILSKHSCNTKVLTFNQWVLVVRCLEWVVSL